MRYLNLFLWPLRLLLRPLRRLTKRVAVKIELGIGGEAARRRRKAQRLARLMLAEFSRLGFTKKIVTGKGKSSRQRVRYEEPLLMTHDELWCPIDLARLPTGIRTDDLRDEAVIRSIEDRLNAGVRIDYLANGKLCFVVRLQGAKFPEVVSINAASIPVDAPPFAVPLGVNADGAHVLEDLTELKHLLVAGATGGGKTTFMHAMISTLIARNSADDIELWLVDLKRTEFNLYRPLLGKRGEGIVKHIAVDSSEAIDVLDRAFKEITRRNQLMERCGATSITDLAHTAGQRLKRIALVIDEFAILTTDTSKIGKQNIGSWATLLMTRIAALGRSAGVTIVIATQFVNKEVLSSMIRANFENRLSFSCADWRQSQLVVETSEADGLPQGRAILRKEGKTMEVQTCLVTPRQVRLEVARISEFGPDGGLGDDDQRRFVREAKILLSVACEQFGGDLAQAKILAAEGVKRVISRTRFDEICMRLERDGVITPGGPKRARKINTIFWKRLYLLDAMYGMDPGNIEAEPISCPVSQPDLVIEGDIVQDSTSDEQEPQQDGLRQGASDNAHTRYEIQRRSLMPPRTTITAD